MPRARCARARGGEGSRGGVHAEPDAGGSGGPREPGPRTKTPNTAVPHSPTPERGRGQGGPQSGAQSGCVSAAAGGELEELDDSQWTVPVHFVVTKLTKFGPLPMSCRLEACGTRPCPARDWRSGTQGRRWPRAARGPRHPRLAIRHSGGGGGRASRARAPAGPAATVLGVPDRRVAERWPPPTIGSRRSSSPPSSATSTASSSRAARRWRASSCITARLSTSTCSRSSRRRSRRASGPLRQRRPSSEQPLRCASTHPASSAAS